MKTMKKTISLLLIMLFMVSCSKDDNNSPAPVTEKKLYPKKIDFFNKDAQGTETFAYATTFSYNENKQVSSINYHGYMPINITYNSNGLPSKIVIVVSSSQQSVCEFEYNGDRIVKFKRLNETYDVGYNAATNTYSYTDQYNTYSLTLNSVKDLTKSVTVINSSQFIPKNKEFFYKNEGFGFFYALDYPLTFYLDFIGLGFDFENHTSIKPLEKMTNNSGNGNSYYEYTNILNADNYIMESLFTWDNSGASSIARYEYEEL